jgi:hypothetical protein
MSKANKTMDFLTMGLRHENDLTRAMKSLADAKNYLLYAEGNVGGHREDVLLHIKKAADEIKAYQEKGSALR